MKRSSFLLLFISALLFGIVLYCLLNMTYNVAPIRYSVSLEEAKKEKTLINEYLVYDANRKQISYAWLENARNYDIFDYKKIEKDKMMLRVKHLKKNEEIENVYWKAFFKDKILTAFEDKGIISVVGVDENMDTIIIKPNKDETFYIILNK